MLTGPDALSPSVRYTCNMRVLYDRSSVPAWDEETLAPKAPVPPRRDPGSVRRRSGVVRSDITARNRARAELFPHEMAASAHAPVVYTPEAGSHGNFFPASYRRICTRPEWAKRLAKRYTASRRLDTRSEHRHAELDTAASSDALLMNIFCHPTALRSAALRGLLGMGTGALQPEFGFHPRVPLVRGLVDRTEVDMRLGDLLVEAKLTESGFGSGGASSMARYPLFESVFDPAALPMTEDVFGCYQLLRNALAAVHLDCRFALLCDARRPDLHEDFLSVVRAMRSAEDRNRMLLVTWQEVATCLPAPLRQFLAIKYGIVPAHHSFR